MRACKYFKASLFSLIFSFQICFSFVQVRAHSRTTRALLLYNNTQLPIVARIRIADPDSGAKKAATPTDFLSDGFNAFGNMRGTKSTSAAFPCHFCSCLSRAPPSTAVHSTVGETKESSSAGTAGSCGKKALAQTSVDSSMKAATSPEELALRCCTRCLCVDESMCFAEPFLLDGREAAARAANTVAAEIMQAGGGHSALCKQQAKLAKRKMGSLEVAVNKLGCSLQTLTWCRQRWQ